jgi:hypothetical protein
MVTQNHGTGDNRDQVSDPAGLLGPPAVPSPVGHRIPLPHLNDREIGSIRLIADGRSNTSFDTTAGDKRTVIELEVDEIGPSCGVVGRGKWPGLIELFGAVSPADPSPHPHDLQ